MNDTAAVVRPPTPFKELDFFVEADAAMFAGREREARQLVSRIVSSRAVVVHARSGLGKTSLLRAGVVPLLRQQSFRPVYARTLDSLLGDLGEAVAQDCGISPSATDGDPEERTRRVIEAAAAGGPLVLMLDQFEEFFTRFERQPRERQAFVQFITDLVRDEKRDVRVVFSLREDYLYALDEFQRKLPDLFAHAFRLLPLTPLGAREAIIRPLANNNVSWDEALINQLVDELTGFDFDSARLQVTCSEVYRHALAGAQGSVALKADDLNSLKESTGTGLRGIYKRYLREAVRNIPEGLRLDSKLLLDKLIGAKRTKFAIGRDALHAEFGETQRVDAVLAVLVEQKLVRCERRGGREWLELRHECLVEEILEWFKEDVTFDSFRFVRGLVEEHSRDRRFRTRPERLLTADQLGALAPLHDLLNLAPEQFEYIVQSAVYAGSPEVRTWAQRDTEAATRLLRALSESHLKQMQVGALRSIGQLDGVAPDLSAMCLVLAFNTSAQPEVREAARKSAAIVATDDQLNTFRTQVMPNVEKSMLRDFLVELHVAGRMGRTFGAWRRWLTRHEVIRRRAQQFADFRAEFVSRGLMGGFCGGGIFALGPSLFKNVIAGGVTREAIGVDLVLLIYVVFCGAIIGWRNGAAAFKTSVIGETRWWRASLPSLAGVTTGKVKGTLAAIALICLSIYTVAWLLWRVVMAGLVAAVEPVVRRQPTSLRRAVVASLICIPPACLLVAVFSFPTELGPVSALLILLGLLNVELCSYSLAIPVKGIEGASTIDQPSGAFSKT